MRSRRIYPQGTRYSKYCRKAASNVMHVTLSRLNRERLPGGALDKDLSIAEISQWSITFSFLPDGRQYRYGADAVGPARLLM